MAAFMYDPAKSLLMKAALDLSASIKVLIVMTDTTSDAERTVATLDEFTTLDEYDGSNYAPQTLSSTTISEDDTNHRALFQADNALFESLGPGTRRAQAVIVYQHVTDHSDSIPIAYIEPDGVPLDGDNDDLLLQWDADGVFQLGD